MMREAVVAGALVLAAVTAVGGAGQQEGDTAGGAVLPQAAADVAQCAQAHATVARLVDAAKLRLESARQANSASAMRDAIDDLQAVLVDITTQLAPCARLQAAAGDPHAGHAMPGAQQAPAPSPRTPLVPPGEAAPAPGADPHGGHHMPGTPPTVTPRSEAPAGRPAPRQPAAPAAARPHAGHAMPSAPPPAASAKREPNEASADSRDGTAATPAPAAREPATRPGPPTTIDGLTCPGGVDPRTAPRMLYEGRMYYFCSEQERAEFSKDPGKYTTTPAESAPSHAH